jgi:hypothetical protein
VKSAVVGQAEERIDSNIEMVPRLARWDVRDAYRFGGIMKRARSPVPSPTTLSV